MSETILENTTQNQEYQTQWTTENAEYNFVISQSSHEALTTKAWIEKYQSKIQTRQEISEIKQEIDKQSFINYMKENWTPLESQSKEIQNLTQEILRPQGELELTQKQQKYNEIKSELLDGIKNKNAIQIASSVGKLLKEFLGSFKRKLNIWNNINYTPNQADKEYLINAIKATLNPEKRSELTYLFWRIKDEENKEKLREKWIENPSQFQLFLQNCKPWQLILINGDSTWAKRHERFNAATQIVSWSRWCHAAIISEIKEENGIIVDATIVQADSKWIKEASLKEYVNSDYKSGDLLLWTFQPPEKWEDVVHSCKSYIWWKYSQINLVADTILDELHISKQKRNKYCSELVFTWMQEAGLDLPDPHTTPADLLSTNAIAPEYCCYCDNFK